MREQAGLRGAVWDESEHRKPMRMSSQTSIVPNPPAAPLRGEGCCEACIEACSEELRSEAGVEDRGVVGESAEPFAGVGGAELGRDGPSSAKKSKAR